MDVMARSGAPGGVPTILPSSAPPVPSLSRSGVCWEIHRQGGDRIRGQPVLPPPTSSRSHIKTTQAALGAKPDISCCVGLDGVDPQIRGPSCLSQAAPPVALCRLRSRKIRHRLDPPGLPHYKDFRIGPAISGEARRPRPDKPTVASGSKIREFGIAHSNRGRTTANSVPYPATTWNPRRMAEISTPRLQDPFIVTTRPTTDRQGATTDAAHAVPPDSAAASPNSPARTSTRKFPSRHNVHGKSPPAPRMASPTNRPPHPQPDIPLDRSHIGFPTTPSRGGHG